jgi:hypothetical protein
VRCCSRQRRSAHRFDARCAGIRGLDAPLTWRRSSLLERGRKQPVTVRRRAAGLHARADPHPRSLRRRFVGARADNSWQQARPRTAPLPSGISRRACGACGSNARRGFGRRPRRVKWRFI